MSRKKLHRPVGRRTPFRAEHQLSARRQRVQAAQRNVVLSRIRGVGERRAPRKKESPPHHEMNGSISAPQCASRSRRREAESDLRQMSLMLRQVQLDFDT